MRYLLAVILILISCSTNADLKTDKAVGNCIGVLATQGKKAAMRDALNMADNQGRAMQFANLWINSATKNQNNKNIIDTMVWSAVSDCREIGIRPSDY